jgi:hypothetical protein
MQKFDNRLRSTMARSAAKAVSFALAFVLLAAIVVGALMQAAQIVA